MASKGKKNRILKEVYDNDYDFFAWDENIMGEYYWDKPEFNKYNSKSEDYYDN